MKHQQVWTCGYIVTIGSIGILVSTFLIERNFIKNLPWYVDPVTYFLIGGLCTIISGCSLLLFYHDQTKENALKVYNWTLISGLLLMSSAAFMTIAAYVLFKIHFLQ